MLRPIALAPDLAWFPTRTPTLPPATTTNSYALGGREVLLVEPATPHEDEQRAFVAWARGLATEGRTLVALFATHHHPDHVGGAARLSRELALPLWAHAETAARIADVPVARQLNDGETLTLDGTSPQHWRVLHTPGHAPGHLCLHEPTLGIAVVGDMVASEGSILIDPIDGHMGHYLAQLERLASLELRLALPAHGAPIEEPRGLFLRYIAHRKLRENAVIAALAVAPRCGATPAELVPIVYADTAPELWPLASLSLEAHLAELARNGHACERAGRWSMQATRA
ncbi:MAG: MBL fold metallo-hydrolase [Myxococcales bacterium]|nr:MBL fold metallo-hydrolase [Myxococcales bacterium]